MDPDDNRIDEGNEGPGDDEGDQPMDGDNPENDNQDGEEQPGPAPEEEEDDDFPEYANEFNKGLNQIVLLPTQTVMFLD